MNKPSLLILAAGMGSRYGGLKQMDPVGPSGEIVLDYSIFDAIRAGFDRVVFVIRRDIEEAFRAAVSAKWESRIPCSFVFQELSDLPAGYTVPEGRAKPWGTAHAIRAGRTALDGPFAQEAKNALENMEEARKQGKGPLTLEDLKSDFAGWVEIP